MANENRYYKTPFAESGNKTEIPDVSVGGVVGYDSGYGPDYELPQGSVNRKRIDRDMFNGMNYGVTKNLKQWQENLYPTWIEDNGDGVAFSYSDGMIVSHENIEYISLEDSNQEEPGTGSKWKTYSVKFINSFTKEATQAEIERVKSGGGGSSICAGLGQQSISTPIEFVGEFTRGVTVDFSRTRFISPSNVNGLEVKNEVGSIASEYFNKTKIVDAEFVGPGKTSGTGVGYLQQAAAGVDLFNLRSISYPVAMFLDGGLTSNFYSPVLRSSGVGVKASFFDDGTGGLNSFSPNANNFFGGQIQKNDVAIDYNNNPSGAVNWFGTDIEANNENGNASDGVKVVNLTNAGHHNMFGCHFESSRGEFGIFYDGANINKSLLMAGVECIDAVDTVTHIEQGILTAIASRITNNTATNDIFIQAGAAATLIDTEARVSGDLSHVIGVKFGRICFGGNPVNIDPLISATSESIDSVSGGVVTDFSSNLMQHNWRDESGARMANVSISTGSDLLITKDGAQAVRFNVNGSNKLYVARLGGNAIEPGSDNTIALGSAALRFSQVFSVNGAINTSDEREKDDIGAIPDEVLDVWETIPVRRFKWREAISRENKGGDKARWHVGRIAQDILIAFKSAGLDATEWGVLCYDDWDEQIVKNEDGKADTVIPAGNIYGVRYEEAAQIEAAMIRRKIGI